MYDNEGEIRTVWVFEPMNISRVSDVVVVSKWEAFVAGYSVVT